MTKSNNDKSCGFFNCKDQADVLLIFSDVSGLGRCSFYLCSKHAAVAPFNVKDDIISEKNLHEVQNNV